MSLSSPASLMRHSFSGAVRTATALGILLTATQVAAQSPIPNPPAHEFRFTSGELITTGNQRNFLKNAPISAVQLSWLVRPSLALTGTFGWARSRDVTSASAHKLDVFTSDVGLEARPAQWFANRAVTFSPFVGLGAGARSYNFRTLDIDATHNVAGYAAAGGELGIRRVGLRLEARTYATGFKPLSGTGKSEMRNDVVVMVGLRFNRQRAPQK